MSVYGRLHEIKPKKFVSSLRASFFELLTLIALSRASRTSVSCSASKFVSDDRHLHGIEPQDIVSFSKSLSVRCIADIHSSRSKSTIG